VGGEYPPRNAAAAETIGLLEPRLVIPMPYKTEVVKMEPEPLERFLKQTGLKEMVTQPKLSVTKSTLPPETKGAVAGLPRRGERPGTR